MSKMSDDMEKPMRIVPKYAILPITLMLTLNALVYFGTKPFTNDLKHYDISGFLDYQIPFIPVFIVPYLLAFLQWILGYLAIARYDRDFCYRVMGGEMISKIIVGIIFILFPTTMLREDIVGTGLFCNAVELLYRIDEPTNLFPSIHCLESYICMRAAIEMKDADKRFRVGMILMSLLVFASTIFIKQHVILDFLGAVITAEVGRLLFGYIFQGYFKTRLIGSTYRQRS